MGAVMKDKGRYSLSPDIGHFHKEWANACKGDLKTLCDFEYSCNLIETMLLGLAAYRVGRKIEYDGARGRVTNRKACC